MKCCKCGKAEVECAEVTTARFLGGVARPSRFGRGRKKYKSPAVQGSHVSVQIFLILILVKEEIFLGRVIRPNLFDALVRLTVIFQFL